MSMEMERAVSCFLLLRESWLSRAPIYNRLTYSFRSPCLTRDADEVI
jgi:hypothetical protein